MRAPLTYDERRAPTRTFEGFDPDTPVAGLYKMRLRTGGVMVGIRIWYGPPHDPVTGEEMDRGWRWQAHANRELIDMERVWPKCADAPITDDDYNHLSGLQSWAKENAPKTAFADPTRKIDPLSASLPF